MSLVMLAVFLPILVLLVGLAIDTANWWVHKRHLQVQADAAALAGATEFRFPGCQDDRIEQTAVRYSGGADPDHVDVNPEHNFMRDATPDDWNRMHTFIQEPGFWGDENEPVLDNDLTQRPGPCEAGFVDVKMTEEDSRGFFARGWVPEIDAQARVELRKLVTTNRLLPLGIEDVNPKRVHVWLYDEETGELLGDADLERRPQAENGTHIYDNSLGNGDAMPILLSNVKSRRMVLRVALSGSNSITCGEPLVLCYGYNAPGAAYPDGFPRIRGYRLTGQGAELGEVALIKRTCGANDYFDNGYFNLSCTAVDVAADLRGVEPTAKVEAMLAGQPSTKRTLTWDSTFSRWTTSGNALPITAGDGPHRVDISYEQKSGTVGTQTCTSSSPCTRTFSNVHMVFAGSRARSGPIQGLRIDTANGQNVNNVRRCEGLEVGCTEEVVVRINTGGRLALQPVYDDQGNLLPPVGLRVFGSGSQNHSLDCDPLKVDHDDDVTTAEKLPDFADEMEHGCKASYTINEGTACLHPNVEYATPQPWDCVAVEPGAQTNKAPGALNERIHCFGEDSANCPQWGKAQECKQTNNWPNWQYGDRRIMSLFLVPFGSFDGQGADLTVPVVDFAFFYVTGYSGKGAGFDNPCKNYAAAPDTFAPGTENDNGVISGYFVTPTNPNLGGGSDEQCDTESIGGCVAVMSK